MELRPDTEIRLADESPRRDLPVEWWIVQGHFEGENVAKSRFMASLCRHALAWKGISAGNAYSLLVSVLDETSGVSTSLSQIDPATIPFLVTALRLAPPAGLDPIAVRALTDEIAEYGLPRSIRTLPGASMDSDQLRARWGDFELSQQPAHFALTFDRPQSQQTCSFQLRPSRPRFHLADVAVANGGSMDYV